MPQNKSQHFVPRTYLKRFAKLDNHKAIALYNFRSSVFVAAAPLRGQCARNYLYGKDLRLEKLLGAVESDFTHASSDMIASPTAGISAEDIEHLRLFLVLQMFRTEYAVEKMRDQFLSMHQLMFHDIDNVPDPNELGREHIVLSSLKIALKLYHVLTDLRFIIIKNSSRSPFITSDAPAVATNRLYLQRYKSDDFGLGQSGTILYLPVDPATAIMFYDSDVYALRSSGSRVINIKSDRDADALNRIIALEANQNIYFRGDINEVSRFISDTRSNFVPHWHTQGVYAPDPASRDYTSYRRVPNDHRQEGSMLYVSSMRHPDPGTWLSQLAFRPRMVGYTNGSAAGYVRRHTATVDGQAVCKVNLNKAPPPLTPSHQDHAAWRTAG